MTDAAQGTVGIVGLGLMGGSLARDLAAAGWRVLGTDRDPAVEAAARDADIVAGPVAMADVDVLVLAVPVRAAPAWLHRLGPRLGPGATVTDVGSTKRSVVEAAEAAGLGPRFVGSHPMAGDHRSGWAASRTGLFRGAAVWLCPAHDAAPATLARIAGLWEAVGAEPRRIDAHDHDRLLARVSHLPQAAATALAAALARDGVVPDQLGPGGRGGRVGAGAPPAGSGAGRQALAPFAAA